MKKPISGRNLAENELFNMFGGGRLIYVVGVTRIRRRGWRITGLGSDRVVSRDSITVLSSAVSGLRRSSIEGVDLVSLVPVGIGLGCTS